MAETPIRVEREKPMMDMPTPPDWELSATFPLTS